MRIYFTLQKHVWTNNDGMIPDMPLAMGYPIRLFYIVMRYEEQSCVIYLYMLGEKVDDLMPLAKCDLGYAVLSMNVKSTEEEDEEENTAH